MQARKLLRYLFVFSILSGVLAACQFAEIRTFEEDAIVKEGFRADQYVTNKWESEIVPTYVENAYELGPLLAELETDSSLITERGNQESEGEDWYFMVKSEARIVVFENSGLFPEYQVDLPPYDGETDILLELGPRISPTLGFAVRDAPGTISFNDFINQTEHGAVATELLNQAKVEIANAFGLADPEMIMELDPADYEGRTITFVGAMGLKEGRDMSRQMWSNIEVVPLQLEIME
ncbi:MAG: DUF2291 domain-containing protein [Chloroflexi bacterium]|nr:DUF2291 domain-containing protein [Chloroflexota bacterium]